MAVFVSLLVSGLIPLPLVVGTALAGVPLESASPEGDESEVDLDPISSLPVRPVARDWRHVSMTGATLLGLLPPLLDRTQLRPRPTSPGPVPRSATLRC